MSNTDKKPTLHLIVRYNQKYNGKDTLLEHKNIADKQGTVWWGKFGVGVAQKIVDQLKEQVEKSEKVYIYLSAKGSIKFKSELVDVIGGGARTTYSVKDKELIPSYYRDTKCTLWLKIKNISEIKNASPSLSLYYGFGKPDLSSMKGIIYVK